MFVPIYINIRGIDFRFYQLNLKWSVSNAWMSWNFCGMLDSSEYALFDYIIATQVNITGS